MAAHNEAHAAGNAAIGSAHLVLGLLSEPEALAAEAIVAAGVSLDSVRTAAAATLPGRADNLPALIPYDPDATKAFELTLREALRLGHNYVGTEHILIALLELEGGHGMLTSLGLDKPTTEAKLMQLIDAATAANASDP